MTNMHFQFQVPIIDLKIIYYLYPYLCQVQYEDSRQNWAGSNNIYGCGLFAILSYPPSPLLTFITLFCCLVN